MQAETTSKSHKVKTMFRLLIVVFTWGVTCVRPDTGTTFFTVLFVTSITSLYEYVIIYLETKDKVRNILSIFGSGLSLIYFAFSLCGLFGIVHLDVQSLIFSLTDKLPLAHPELKKFAYIYTLPLMLLFPFLVGAEFFLKKEEATASPAMSVTRQKTARL